MLPRAASERFWEVRLQVKERTRDAGPDTLSGQYPHCECPPANSGFYERRWSEL
jgi:hypothetical protein